MIFESGADQGTYAIVTHFMFFAKCMYLTRRGTDLRSKQLIVCQTEQIGFVKSCTKEPLKTHCLILIAFSKAQKSMPCHLSQ